MKRVTLLATVITALATLTLAVLGIISFWGTWWGRPRPVLVCHLSEARVPRAVSESGVARFIEFQRVAFRVWSSSYVRGISSCKWCLAGVLPEAVNLEEGAYPDLTLTVPPGVDVGPWKVASLERTDDPAVKFACSNLGPGALVQGSAWYTTGVSRSEIKVTGRSGADEVTALWDNRPWQDREMTKLRTLWWLSIFSLVCLLLGVTYVTLGRR